MDDEQLGAMDDDQWEKVGGKQKKEKIETTHAAVEVSVYGG